MPLAGTPAIFFLSPEGEQALSRWFGKRTSFPALMVSTDATGAWIRPPAGPVEGADTLEPLMLLKWDYVETVTFEYEQETGPVRAPIGFR